MLKQSNATLINQVASKRIIDKNFDAFQTYDAYKKAAEIIELAETASGNRVSFKSDAGSTLNFEINRHGAYSTAQEI